MTRIFRTLIMIVLVRGTVASIFNPEELVNVHYDVDIIGEPKLSTESIQSATSMTLLSKHGQRYECILPTNMYTIGHSGTVADEHLKEKTVEEEDESKKAKSSIISIPKLLDGMEEGPCLRLSKGWWEYELCFRRRIRQYHRNEQNGAIENEIILGEFTSEFDWKTADVPTEKSTSRRKGPRSHTQEYTKGSICDLTGNQRRADVVYQCDLTPQAMDALVDVEEPASCIYRLTVKTPRLCDNPLLRRAAEEQMPSRRRPPETIQCRPLLEPESMMKYKEVQAKKEAAKQRAAEAKRLKAVYKKSQSKREPRILDMLLSKYRGPLRRRKFDQFTRQRFAHLRYRVLLTEDTVFVSDKEMESSPHFPPKKGKALKKATKEPKKTSKASQAEQKRPERKKSAKDENFEALRKAISTLPEAVRRKLTSTEGLDSLKSGLGSQVRQILEAAKSEVGVDGLDSEGSQQEIMKKISEMIDQLLVQVNNAGKRLDEEAKMLDARAKELQKERLERTGQGTVDDTKSSTTPATEKKRNKELEKEREDEQPKIELLKKSSSTAQDEATREPGDEHLTPELITLADQAAEAEKLAAEGDGQGAAVGKEPSAMAEQVEAMRGRLETELRQKMSKTGMDSNVLLHVMTVADKDGNERSGKKEKPAFVGIIILKNDQQQREEERMKRLDKNYNFRIDDPAS